LGVIFVFEYPRHNIEGCVLPICSSDAYAQMISVWKS